MIRRMTEEDLPAAVLLEKKYFPDPWSEAVLRECLAHPLYHFFVAEEEGKVEGYAGILCVQDEGDIVNIVVDQDWRGHGLGSSLMKTLMEEGRRRGIRAFTLEVRVSNRTAILFYKGLGFVPAGVRRRYYEHPPEDALIMWKREPEQ